MAIRNLRRQASRPGAYSGTTNAAPIYVDSDDNIVKIIPAGSGTTEVQLVDASSAQTLTNKTSTSQVLTTPVIDGVTYSAANDRQAICEVVAISGAALQAANLTLWTAPAAAIIERVILDVTTVATGACTVDIGYATASATTSSDTLLDGVDVNAAIAVFDSMNAALDSGANAKAQKAASGKWITADSASGDATGLVANVYIYYTLA